MTNSARNFALTRLTENDPTYTGNLIDSLISTVDNHPDSKTPSKADELESDDIELERRIRNLLPLTVEEVLDRVSRSAS